MAKRVLSITWRLIFFVFVFLLGVCGFVTMPTHASNNSQFEDSPENLYYRSKKANSNEWEWLLLTIDGSAVQDQVLAKEMADFPDKAFRESIRAKYHTLQETITINENEYTINRYRIDYDKVAAEISLNCSSAGNSEYIKDITGIENFTSLNSLEICNEELSDLPCNELAQLVNLRTVNVSNNEIRHMPDLKGCAGVERLLIYDNIIPMEELRGETFQNKIPSLLKNKDDWTVQQQRFYDSDSDTNFRLNIISDFYAVGDKHPFAFEIKGMKSHRSYKANVTVNGVSTLLNGNSTFFSEDLPGVTNGKTLISIKLLDYTLENMSDDDRLLRSWGAVEVTFHGDEPYVDEVYIPESFQTQVRIEGKIQKKHFGTEDIHRLYLRDSKGEIIDVICQSYQAVDLSDNSDPYYIPDKDKRYKVETPSLLRRIENNDAVEVTCSFSTYGSLPIGTYGVYITAGVYTDEFHIGNLNITSLAVVTGTTVIDGDYYNDGDSVYLDVTGVNINTNNVRPSLYRNGRCVAEYSGEATITGENSDRCVVYKLTKLKRNSNDPWDFGKETDYSSVEYTIKYEADNVTDASENTHLYYRGSKGFRNGVAVFYNQRKKLGEKAGCIETVFDEQLSEEIPAGTEVSVQSYSINDYNDEIIEYAAGSGIVDSTGKLHFVLYDNDGKEYTSFATDSANIKKYLKYDFESVHDEIVYDCTYKRSRQSQGYNQVNANIPSTSTGSVLLWGKGACYVKKGSTEVDLSIKVRSDKLPENEHLSATLNNHSVTLSEDKSRYAEGYTFFKGKWSGGSDQLTNASYRVTVNTISAEIGKLTLSVVDYDIPEYDIGSSYTGYTSKNEICVEITTPSNLFAYDYYNLFEGMPSIDEIRQYWIDNGYEVCFYGSNNTRIEDVEMQGISWNSGNSILSAYKLPENCDGAVYVRLVKNGDEQIYGGNSSINNALNNTRGTCILRYPVQYSSAEYEVYARTGNIIAKDSYVALKFPDIRDLSFPVKLRFTGISGTAAYSEIEIHNDDLINGFYYFKDDDLNGISRDEPYRLSVFDSCGMINCAMGFFSVMANGDEVEKHARQTYDIFYNLDGGTYEEGRDNPPAYNYNSALTLNNPVREGYLFAGWTGTRQSEPVMTLTIPIGSKQDRGYVANWIVDPDYKKPDSENEDEKEQEQSDSVTVTGIALDNMSIELAMGAQFQLNAIVTSANAPDKSVTWSTGDDKVAIVDQTGMVTAIKAGQTTITVKTNVADKSATCMITVTKKSVGDDEKTTRISEEDVDALVIPEKMEKTIESDSVKIRNENKAVSLSVSYDNATTYTGAVIKPDKQLNAHVNTDDILVKAGIAGKTGEEMFDVTFGGTNNKNAGSKATFYAKIKLKKGATKGMGKKEKKALNSAIAAANKALKNNPITYTINKASLADLSLEVHAKLKKRRIVVKNGKLKNIKSVKVLFPGKKKKTTLKSSVYSQSEANVETGTVRITGKKNYTGSVTVIVKK